MKKLLLSLTIVFGAMFAANAQRTVDLEVTLTSPAVSGTIDSGVTFQTTAIVKNVGTTDLKATDSIIYSMTLGGNTIQLNSATIFYIPSKNGKVMKPNDTFMISRSFSLNYTTPVDTDQKVNYCVVAAPLNRTADSVKDNVGANNNGCNQVTLKAHYDPTAIGSFTEVTDRFNVSAYPNPASSVLNITIATNTYHSNATIAIRDITGRLVATKAVSRLNTGNNSISINTQSLTNGIYLYQVSVDGVVRTGKFSVAK